MPISRKEPIILLVGDLVIFSISLWLTLLLRNGALPTLDTLKAHFLAFLPLFLTWLLVFFIAGLYERHTMILRGRLPALVIKAQVINSVIAVAFFYFAAFIQIAPKTVLFMYLIISSLLAIAWRLYGYKFMEKGEKHNALLIGEGQELRELEAEVNHNDLYGLRFVSAIDFDDLGSIDISKDLVEKIYAGGVSVIAVDTANEKISPLLPHLYNLVFSRVKFVSLHKFYEEIFKRVPLSLVRYNWFLENLSRVPGAGYDIVKRIIDITVALVLGTISLAVYPLVALAIKINDGGKIFIVQDRVGKNNRVIKIIKFRTMAKDDKGQYGGNGTDNQVTKIGRFLRKVRIDELPQLWNVLKGDLSLIGPRPELPELVKIYEAKVPFYNVRHLIKPGLSGWAQLYHDNHPHHLADVEETKIKLSYDLFYIKNRSFVVDLKIFFKTVKILLSLKGK